MAIAYFIPDQAQLLARSYQQSGHQAAASPRTTAAPAAPLQQQQQAQQQQSQQQQQPHPQQQRPQFRANISVPLGSQQGSMTMSEFGCWDLLAQIFCYALRIYSYSSSQRRPMVIQISFEISSGGQNNEEDDVTDATSKEN